VFGLPSVNTSEFLADLGNGLLLFGFLFLLLDYSEVFSYMFMTLAFVFLCLSSI